MSRRQSLFLKLAISVTIMAIIFSVVDFGATLEVLRNVDWKLLILPLVLMFSQTAISTWKWKIILAFDKIELPFLFLFETYLIGQFLSLFLPSSIGGDVYRMAAIKSRATSISRSLSSVLFDRLSGAYGLLLIAAIGAAILLPHNISYLILIAIIASPVLLAMVTIPKITKLLIDYHSRLLPAIGNLMSAQRKLAFSASIFPVMGISLLLFHLDVVLRKLSVYASLVAWT